MVSIEQCLLGPSCWGKVVVSLALLNLHFVFGWAFVAVLKYRVWGHCNGTICTSGVPTLANSGSHMRKIWYLSTVSLRGFSPTRAGRQSRDAPWRRRRRVLRSSERLEQDAAAEGEQDDNADAANTLPDDVVCLGCVI